MMPVCPICDEPFKDGDKAVASMLTIVHGIESDVHYAVEHPSRCLELVHSECYDWESYDGPDEEVII